MTKYLEMPDDYFLSLIYEVGDCVILQAGGLAKSTESIPLKRLDGQSRKKEEIY